MIYGGGRSVIFTLERGDSWVSWGLMVPASPHCSRRFPVLWNRLKEKLQLTGEVAALLELGSGFDGDLTVKENAYLRGAMLGYTKEFMDETYDHIIDFAGTTGV